MVTKKALLLILFFMMVCSQANAEVYKKKIPDAQLFDFEANNETLKEASVKVFQKTGYKISFDEKLESIPVKGRYNHITIDEFFHRILRDKNISIISNDKERHVIIRMFGQKETDKSRMVNIGGVGAVDPVTGRDLSSVIKENKEQEARLEAWKNDPTAVDPVTGRNLSEVRRENKEQEAKLEAWKNDPATVDPVTGRNLAEIRKENQEQEARLERMKNDPAAIDPVTGRNLAEIRKENQEQEARLERWKNDPATIDPVTGRNLADIRRENQEQEEKLRQMRGGQ